MLTVASPQGAMAVALLPVMKAHAAERAARKGELERRIDGALDAAEDVENNARACFGIELRTVESNQQQLEASAKQLRAQVRDLSHQFTVHIDKFEAMVDTMATTGSAAQFLKQSETILAAVRGHFTAIERLLGANPGE